MGAGAMYIFQLAWLVGDLVAISLALLLLQYVGTAIVALARRAARGREQS
jgi:hypothetical protein